MVGWSQQCHYRCSNRLLEGPVARNAPSEFGGYGGLQQPPPHEETAAEKLRNWHLYSDPAVEEVDVAVEVQKAQEAAGWKGEDSL